MPDTATWQTVLRATIKTKKSIGRGDRSYNEAWGTAEDYRDGYQQGFEVGYGAGYDRRSFDSTIPTGLARRGTVDSGNATNSGSAPNYPETTTDNSANNTNVAGAGNSGPLFLPRDAVLVVELESSLSTDATQVGDRFQRASGRARRICRSHRGRARHPGKEAGESEGDCGTAAFF